MSKKMIFILEGFYTILMSSFIVISQQKTKEEQQIEETLYNDMVEEIYIDIDKEFRGDLRNWGAEFDRGSLTMTFSRDSTDNPIIMFDNGKHQPTSEYQSIIEDFCPRYFDKIKGYLKSGAIEEIEINGHTSSEWLRDTEQFDSYTQNMRLSQERSQNVFNICMSSIKEVISEKDTDLFWLFVKKTTANGKSWSSLKIDKDGVENREASRRVEFRIITSIQSRVEELPSTKL